MDGNYVLSIDGAKVRDRASGELLDGDRDGVAGGRYVFGASAADAFFRLYGDTDGDRDVDTLDWDRFRLAFQKRRGNPGYRADLDYDANGIIDPNDLRQFWLRLGKRLAPGAGTGSNALSPLSQR